MLVVGSAAHVDGVLPPKIGTSAVDVGDRIPMEADGGREILAGSRNRPTRTARLCVYVTIASWLRRRAVPGRRSSR
jgi:hypothetical protein